MSSNSKSSFDSHLTRIRSAKEETKNVLENTTLAEQSIGLLWERLFNLLCLSHQPDWQEMKSLSDVLKKATQSYSQLKAIGMKENTKNSNTEDSDALLLSDETLADIEEQLQLL